MNWPMRIAQYERLARELHSVMFGAELPYLAPNPAATEEQLKKLEAEIGVELDLDHKEFLRCANGWPSFTGTISLLGTERVSQSKELALAKRNINAISGVALGPYRKQRKVLIPVGVSDATLDVICMIPKAHRVHPETIWFNNTEPDAYPSFSAFFDMLASTLPISIEHYSKKSSGRGGA